MLQRTIVWLREDLLADNPALTTAAAGGAVLLVYVLEDEVMWNAATKQA